MIAHLTEYRAKRLPEKSTFETDSLTKLHYHVANLMIDRTFTRNKDFAPKAKA